MAVMIRTIGVGTGTGVGDAYLFSSWWLPGTAGGSTADATDVLARFRSCWNTLAAKIATGLTITYDPVCIAVEATTGVLTGAFTGTQPANSTSSGGSSPLPRQTQGLLRINTNSVVGGRRVQGRLFVPVPDEGDNDTDATPTSSYTSQLNTGGAALLAAGATASTLVVWHRPQGGGGGQAVIATGVSAQDKWAIQRRRRA